MLTPIARKLYGRVAEVRLLQAFVSGQPDSALEATINHHTNDVSVWPKRGVSLSGTTNVPFLRFKRISRAFSTTGGGSQKRSPYEVLGLKPYEKLTLKSLNKRYAELIKIHHPDVSKLPNAAQVFLEIKEAYDTLKPQLARESGNEQTTSEQASNVDWSSADKEEVKTRFNLKTEEDYLYFIIFGKTYEEDPEAYFLIENSAKRRSYLQQVEKLRSSTVNRDTFRPSSTPRVFETQESSKTVGPIVAVLLIGGVLIAAFFTLQTHKERVTHEEDLKSKHLSNEQVSNLREGGWKREREIIQKKVDKIYSDIPTRVKKFPFDKEVSTLEMLLDYTIWKDIRVAINTNS